MWSSVKLICMFGDHLGHVIFIMSYFGVEERLKYGLIKIEEGSQSLLGVSTTDIAGVHKQTRIITYKDLGKNLSRKGGI